MSAPGTDPLLLGLAAGDERALAALYDRFAARMYRVALRILGSREDAEDVVQEVFLATVRLHERLADVRDLTAYLFTAIHRAAGRCAMRRARAVPISLVIADEAMAPVEPATSDARAVDGAGALAGHRIWLVQYWLLPAQSYLLLSLL